MTGQSKRQELLERLYRNRPMAHRVLFAHRHTDKFGRPTPSPPFHEEMMTDWAGPSAGVLDMVFRGGGKSTIAEESICIQAGFREFKNCLVVCENADRAAARLHAIRREIETNERLQQAFGSLRGSSWGDDELILSTGHCIKALGKGQSLRGIKHEDARPDLVYLDDLENRDDVKTPEARKKTLDWCLLDLMPALDPAARVRVAATPLHPEALPMILKMDPDFIVHLYPIYYLGADGQKVSSWPERFPLKAIEKLERSYRERGQIQGFNQEYLCQAEAPESKAFKREQMLVEPQVRTWQATYSFTDPARTIKSTSADTGRVVASWIGHKLVVWDAIGAKWMPNEIVDDLFHVHDAYRPAVMGIEEDGLNLWLMQPIRQEQLKRKTMLPVQAFKAPNSKLDFIKGMQPFFQAREVVFAKPLPDLQSQLLGFPNGNIDVPNALAYMMKMRPGAPMYDDFGARHAAEDLRPLPGHPVWLCLNATRAYTTGLLVQVLDGSIRVYGDYVREGEPSAVATDILTTAQLDAGTRVRCTAGPLHFDHYNNVGLKQALARVPVELRPGVPPERGRGQIRNLLQREKLSMPMVMISSAARWTMNGFAAGYARVVLKGGMLADHAEEGIYRTLIEGLESFVGLVELGRSTDERDDATFNAVTHDGRPYRSMRGR